MPWPCARISTRFKAVIDLDVTTFAVAPVVFLGIALLASYLPASRATKVDPLEAMREG
ncbi:MAG: hypothetical protein JO300_07495 [Silvibacterium sp.]|nr:hypothetical protein [Silvibacterium sp.]